MPDRMPLVRYVCSYEEMEMLLEETCTTVLETLGYAVNEPEEQVIGRTITAALDGWRHAASVLVPQPRRAPKCNT